MIRDSELTLIGRFNKPHGVSGEIAATLFYDDLDLRSLRCIVVKVDAINVPFFLTELRPKGRETVLLSIDGYSSDESVAVMTNKDIYALSTELREAIGEDEEEDDGFYAADLAGYTLLDGSGATIGTIEGIEDSTANVLFIVRRPGSDKEVFVPVADEFITDINPDTRTIVMQLPEGLLSL